MSPIAIISECSIIDSLQLKILHPAGELSIGMVIRVLSLQFSLLIFIFYHLELGYLPHHVLMLIFFHLKHLHLLGIVILLYKLLLALDNRLQQLMRFAEALVVLMIDGHQETFISGHKFQKVPKIIFLFGYL